MGECLITRRGGSVKSYALTISTTPSAMVTITNNKKTYTQMTDSSGNVIFSKIMEGTWDIIVTKGELRAERTVYVTGNELIEIILNTIPEFTFEVDPGVTGKYAIYDHLDNDITENPETNGDWKIKFFESGNLVFQSLNGAEYGIDVFLVGGGGGGGNGGRVDPASSCGGGGGGGGYTNTYKGVQVVAKKEYRIVVGAGGHVGGDRDSEDGGEGGTSVFDNFYAHGGKGGTGLKWAGYVAIGGEGGSGGATYSCGLGGTNGGAGGGGILGQNSPTTEFGEPDGTLYSGGGTGGMYTKEVANPGPVDETAGYAGHTPPANRGGGGGGSDHPDQFNGTAGASGIVIIRNKR